MTGSGSEAPLLLLVEDNETIRQAFTILLEENGYRVIEAATGAEAVRLAETMSPQLILLDLGLPDTNGLDVTRRIKSNPETGDIVVVAITGRALETDQAACLAAGCAGYITKPVDTTQLLRRIPEFLAAR